MLRGTAGYGCRLVCMPPRGAWYAAPCAVTPGRVVAMPVISASRSTHHYAAEQHHGFDTGPSTHSGAPRQAVAASIRIGHWARGPQPSATAAARERGPNATRRAQSRRRKFGKRVLYNSTPRPVEGLYSEFARIGCFNRHNSARRGGSVQYRTSREPFENERLIELPHRAGERARRVSIQFSGGRPLRVPPKVRAPSMVIGNELGQVGGDFGRICKFCVCVFSGF